LNRFQDITCLIVLERRFSRDNAPQVSGTANFGIKVAPAERGSGVDDIPAELSSAGTKDDIPTKIVGKKSRIQFTCDFKEFSVGGRADLRAVKTFISKVLPQNVAVLSGSSTTDMNDIMAVADVVGKLNIQCHFGSFMTALRVQLKSDKLDVIIPQSLVSDHLKSGLSNSSSSTCDLTGYDFIEVKSSLSNGIRCAKLLINQVLSKNESELVSCGPISEGEVSLETVKARLEQAGVRVEYKRGGTLILDNTVIVKKENDNDFSIEGPSCKALYAARQALYSHFIFV
jgi:hypothetical protein